MRSVAFAAMFAACMGVSGVAMATDLYTPSPEPEYLPPSTLWTGFYFGGHAGWSWGNTDVHDVFNYGGDPVADNSVDTSGLIAGIQLGYNFRRGNIVYGIEADLGYMDLSGSGSFALPNGMNGDPRGGLSSTYSLSGGLYGDLTARIGYAADRTLLYLKGGAAFVNTDFDSHYVGQNCSTTNLCNKLTPNPSIFDFDNSDTLWGWTAGVGVEYALSQSWSLKLEYQHFDFGSTSFSYDKDFKFNKNGYTSHLDGDVKYAPTVDAVKLGVNYQFGSGEGESLK
jgi:outer membrane immunogenic protein